MGKIDLKEVDKKLKEGYMRVRVIIEVAGFPEEHIKKTMDLLAEAIEKENILVISKKINPPKKFSEKIWSSFIEVDFLVKKLSILMGFIFDYLPSSIEIVEPHDTISEGVVELMGMLNDLVAKLHAYSQGMKKLIAENNILKRELIKLKEEKK